MEEKKTNELTDDALDEAVGGGSAGAGEKA